MGAADNDSKGQEQLHLVWMGEICNIRVTMDCYGLIGPVANDKLLYRRVVQCLNILVLKQVEEKKKKSLPRGAKNCMTAASLDHP
ncbi:hypothetical protein AC578_927 [Pseudocercospora eumusae]|uniref:Uncharacterized protein n=1 Tax=Pseudocercospora eumusae TaxID=321146 RepID=A0A139HBW2_9PEZI|nr:hypothetical protein AC578_927 [Pseudocercospora eumusae]